MRLPAVTTVVALLALAISGCGITKDQLLGAGLDGDVEDDALDAFVRPDVLLPPDGTGTVCQLSEPPVVLPDAGPPIPSDGGALSPDAVLRAVNTFREAAGLRPLEIDGRLVTAAASHALFVADNDEVRCWPSLHDEVMDPQCQSFTGHWPWDRMTAAGYPQRAANELIRVAPSNTPAVVQTWADSVYSRIALLSPAYTDLGYGEASGVQVLDLGATAAQSAPRGVVVFPAPGQADVPVAFHGNLEQPLPPPPDPGARGDAGTILGWPAAGTGPVVSALFPGPYAVMVHELFDVDAGCTPVSHSTHDQTNDLFVQRNAPNYYYLYADAPLAPGHHYTVRLEGTVSGRAFSRIWTFSTAGP